MSSDSLVSAQYATEPVQGVWTQAETVSFSAKKSDLPGSIHIVLQVKNQAHTLNVSTFYQSLLLRFKTLGTQIDFENKEAFQKNILKLLQEVESEAKQLHLEILISYTVGDSIVIAGFGGVSAVLIRGADFGRIFQAHKVHVVSGELKPGDIVLLSSENFYKEFSFSKLKHIFTERFGALTLDSLVSEFVVRFHKDKEHVPVGFILLRYIGQVDPPQKKRANPFVWFSKKLKTRRKKAEPKQKPVFVKAQLFGQKKQRISLVVILFLALILMISIAFGRYRNKKLEAEAAFEADIKPVQVLYQEAISMQSINQLRARDVLLQAQSQIQPLLEKYPDESEFDSELEALAQQIETAYEEVSAEYQVDLVQFLDLGFIEEGFFGEKMGLLDDRLVVLDTENDQLVSIGVSNKDPSEVVASDQLRGGSYVSGALKLAFVLTDSGVVQADFGNETTEVVIETDPDWRDIGGFAAFAGNVYILDREVGEIWRYRSVSENNFVRQRWLAPGVNPDFSDVEDMVIDGDIWVLDYNGAVRQYQRGVGRLIEWQGFEESMEATSLGVTEEFVVVLERSKNRVVVFNRDGIYQKQFSWSETSLVTDMVVSENKAILLSGEKLWEIEL